MPLIRLARRARRSVYRGSCEGNAITRKCAPGGTRRVSARVGWFQCRNVVLSTELRNPALARFACPVSTPIFEDFAIFVRAAPRLPQNDQIGRARLGACELLRQRSISVQR